MSFETRSREVIVFVGMRKTGKTTTIKKMALANKERVIIYDINNEKGYKEFPLITPDKIPNVRAGIFRVMDVNFRGVLKQFDTNFKNGLVILEDANFYLTPQRDEALWHILVSLRHKGVDLALTFHSFDRVPPYVLSMMSVLVIFKTGDDLKKVKKRVSVAAYNEWLKAMRSPDRFYKKIIKIQ